MSDSITRLNIALEGRYSIERELGEGGMATVYLADDLKHERKVALKVLKPELAAVVGAERFLAEIKTTANLQHPHILPLFDSGEADSFLFYVMPYVEGETLRDRLDREHQLPVDDAVRIAVNVAEALDYAHGQGVIHRDIKPANILLQAGKPVISDFGIALAVGVAGGGRLTETGLSLGTPHYMSPEQATGDLSVGVTTDVYALGCVLYEMLVGEPPYTGSTAQAILGKIITGDLASATQARASVPNNVDAAIRKALEKLPADRFGGAQLFANALAEPGFTYGTSAAVVAARAGSGWLPWMGWLAAVGAASVAVALGVRDEPNRDVGRFAIQVPTGHQMAHWESPLVTISRDGRTIAYGSDGRLYIRKMDQLEAYPLEGTEGAIGPFLSADGAWLGFNQGGRLRKISTEGGSIREIGVTVLFGGSQAAFGESEAIVYSGASTGAGLFLMRREGVEPEQITNLRPSEDEFYHLWPQLLDGDRLVLYTVSGPGGLWEDASIVLQDVETGERLWSRPNATFARYIPAGYIIYAEANGAVIGLPFDLDAARETGSSFPIEEGVRVAGWGGSASLAISESGAVAMVRGTTADLYYLRWFDRQGQALSDIGPLLSGYVRLSPDASQLLTWVSNPTNADLFVMDAVTGVSDRVASGPTWEWSGVWSPDASTIAYSAAAAGYNVIRMRSVDGTDEPTVLHEGDNELWPTSWSGDGRWIAFDHAAVGRRQDVLLVDTENPSRVDTLAGTEAWECCGMFSPDAQWIAYQSDKTGEAEIYIQRFQGTGEPQQVSLEGGEEPRWAASTGELFFVRDGQVMLGGTIENGTFVRREPADVIIDVEEFRDTGEPHYDVTPDGQRFLLRVVNPASMAHEIEVVLNWFDVVREAEGRARGVG